MPDPKCNRDDSIPEGEMETVLYLNVSAREAPKIMGSPLKGPLFTLLHSVPLTLQQATVDPHLPRDSWTFTGISLVKG